MKYKNYEYQIVQSEDDPRVWHWTVLVNQQTKGGKVGGSRQKAVAFAQFAIDKLVLENADR
jgi:hypothetical protein